MVMGCNLDARGRRSPGCGDDDLDFDSRQPDVHIQDESKT